MNVYKMRHGVERRREEPTAAQRKIRSDASAFEIRSDARAFGINLLPWQYRLNCWIDECIADHRPLVQLVVTS